MVTAKTDWSLYIKIHPEVVRSRDVAAVSFKALGEWWNRRRVKVHGHTPFIPDRWSHLLAGSATCWKELTKTQCIRIFHSLAEVPGLVVVAVCRVENSKQKGWTSLDEPAPMHRKTPKKPKRK